MSIVHNLRRVLKRLCAPVQRVEATHADAWLWKQIRNEELTASNIPSPGASWDQIKRFAGSFDASAVPQAEGYHKLLSQIRVDFLAGKKMSLATLGLSELRAVLFLHWRAIRHAYCGGEPSSSEMAFIWELIDTVRRKVSY